MPRHEITLTPTDALTVNLTDEGIIIDAWSADQLVGTIGMTYDEWFFYVEGQAHD